jgi:putative transcription antitermination factor YqgF
MAATVIGRRKRSEKSRPVIDYFAIALLFIVIRGSSGNSKLTAFSRGTVPRSTSFLVASQGRVRVAPRLCPFVSSSIGNPWRGNRNLARMWRCRVGFGRCNKNFVRLAVASSLESSNSAAVGERGYINGTAEILSLLNATEPFEDKVVDSQASLYGKRKQVSLDEQSSRAAIFDAAVSAGVQASCSLLGVKSIGVDYGLVRTGVAVTVGYEPKPLAILTSARNRVPETQPGCTNNTNAATSSLCQEIVRLVQIEEASRIVVGLPLHKNGTEAEQTQLTRQFGTELAQVVLRRLGPSIAMHYWDERYTSKVARAKLQASSKVVQSKQIPSWMELYGTLDADSACLILEHYYEENGLNAEEIAVPERIRTECLREFEAKESENDRQRQQMLLERDERMQHRRRWIEELRKRETSEGLTEGLAAAAASKKKKKKRRR